LKGLEDLETMLFQIDGRGYSAYRGIQGCYGFAGGALYIDAVQRDPFAAPSKLRFRLDAKIAAVPKELFETATRKLALADFLGRRFAHELSHRNSDHQKHATGNSGTIEIDAGGQEVIERTAVKLDVAWVELRLAVGLPAAGRIVLGRAAQVLLCQELPELARRALRWEHLPQDEARQFVECVENQEFLREQLEARDLVAFVANGSILPRVTGVSQQPLAQAEAIPFTSPPSLRVTFELRHALPKPTHDQHSQTITGMGIPQGVTLIVGGGYHGKSTLLRALQDSVVPHIPGDGREYVVTRRGSVKIRAEDGRRVEAVNLQPFITDLPTGKPTGTFCTENASGSTSQAANILEALEVGSPLLLLDEDTCATNFMIRDARMQELIDVRDEPITPFLHRVRELFERFQTSTILVMGGCGDYFDVADTVIRMHVFQPIDVTQQAHTIAATSMRPTRTAILPTIEGITPRRPLPSSFDASRGRREVKIDAKRVDLLMFGAHPIDLRSSEQLFDRSQTRAIGYAIHWLAQNAFDGKRTLREALERLEQVLDTEGLESLSPFRRPGAHPGNLARPRPQDIAAAVNRLRSLKVAQTPLNRLHKPSEETT